MKILKFDEIGDWTEPVVLVLGYFDGLHLGHKSLFDEARKIAAVLGLKIAVLTFPERPVLTFKQYEPELLLKLTSDARRADLFAQYGVDYLIMQDFTSAFAAQTSQEFVEQAVKPLRPQVVVTGFDYTTGSDMVNLHSGADFKVVTVPERDYGGAKISSTRIRRAVQTGQMAAAAALLGYPYETTGLVVHGFKRGREIGYPTANLVIKDYVHIPAAGVYTVDVIRGGARLRGFASIGFNDTFGNKEQTIEVNIFDFHAEIYGERLTVLWLDKIRDMKKFDGVDALIAQMKADERVARGFVAADE